MSPTQKLEEALSEQTVRQEELAAQVAALTRRITALERSTAHLLSQAGTSPARWSEQSSEPESADTEQSIPTYLAL